MKTQPAIATVSKMSILKYDLPLLQKTDRLVRKINQFIERYGKSGK